MAQAARSKQQAASKQQVTKSLATASDRDASLPWNWQPATTGSMQPMSKYTPGILQLQAIIKNAYIACSPQVSKAKSKYAYTKQAACS